jgi:hypothetical protein
MRYIKHQTKKSYTCQRFPQSKRLSIIDGNVVADFNPEIGSAISCDRYHGVIITIMFDGDVTDKALRAFYRRHKADFRVIAAGHTTEWRNGNLVGLLTADADNALSRLQYEAAIMDPYV